MGQGVEMDLMNENCSGEGAGEGGEEGKERGTGTEEGKCSLICLFVFKMLTSSIFLNSSDIERLI